MSLPRATDTAKGVSCSESCPPAEGTRAMARGQGGGLRVGAALLVSSDEMLVGHM